MYLATKPMVVLITNQRIIHSHILEITIMISLPFSIHTKIAAPEVKSSLKNGFKKGCTSRNNTCW